MAKKNYKGQFEEGAASKSVISLSQLILSPLEAILKAQVHASRSFLNLVLQLGYPHIEVDKDGKPKNDNLDKDKLYMQEFKYETKDQGGNPVTSVIKIPALALVPISPLSIDQADFSVDFRVSHVFRHQQLQESEIKNLDGEKKTDYNEYRRPWFLVKDPVSIRGVIAPKASEEIKEDNSEESSIKINIKISRQARPAGIDKLLTSLTQANNNHIV